MLNIDRQIVCMFDRLFIYVFLSLNNLLNSTSFEAESEGDDIDNPEKDQDGNIFHFVDDHDQD